MLHFMDTKLKGFTVRKTTGWRRDGGICGQFYATDYDVLE